MTVLEPPRTNPESESDAARAKPRSDDSATSEEHSVSPYPVKQAQLSCSHMSTPLVSVVLPSTGSPYLGEAISSVLAQTMTDFELIVVDSTARGDLDLGPWPDPRIRVIKVPWSGVAVARNAGNAAARAPHIAVIDHDDRWLPTKLERQLPHLETSPDVGMSYTQFRAINAFGSVTGHGLTTPGEPITEFLAGRLVFVLHSSTLWRRSVIERVGGYEPRFQPAADYGLFLKVLLTSTVVYEPTVQAEYGIHSANVSRSYQAQYASLLTILRQHLPALAAQSRVTGLTRGQRAAVEHSLRAAYLGPAWDATVRGVRARQFRSALGHGMFAARMNPVLVARLLAKWGWHRPSKVAPGS